MKTLGKTRAGSSTAAKPRAATAKAPRNRQPAAAKLAELKHRLLEIDDLVAAGAVLGWDQATYMPQGGASARARQGATLSRLAHEKLTDPAVGKLLDDLASYGSGLSYDSDDASLLRIARRDFEKAVKLSPSYVARASAAGFGLI
jgi:carboxypeptidase Taq